MKSLLAHAEKDNTIEQLKKQVAACKTSGRHSVYGNITYNTRQILTTSANNSLADQASSLRFSKSVHNSRDTIIRSLSGMPVFENDAVAIENKIIGAGRFGTIKQAKLHKLRLTVAAKIMDTATCSKKAILSEAIVGMTLSGHNSFPYFFGLVGESIILMEYLRPPKGSTREEAAPTLAMKLKSGISRNELRHTCCEILKAIAFMHSKKILHNDIKSDNVIVSNTVKVIDFGKATLMSNPVVYNIAEGSQESVTYNTRHRHLAHELRNISGSKQSVLTDTYSIGYLLKHAGGTICHQSIIQLGRMMKCRNPYSRISIENCLDKFQKLEE